MTFRFAPTARTWVIAALLTVVTAGCSDGQLVDAGGEGGGGGLAFVLLVVFFFLFLGSLFYMDRVRQRRQGDKPE